MTFDLRNLPSYFNSNTDFQNWVAGIHAQLAAVGLVQTSDTGQINPATVLAPGAATTIQGYEIWRFNDSLQATVPVFIKIEYGSGGVSTDAGWALTVGSGSNGAGTLSGQRSQRTQLFCQAATTVGVTFPSYFAGSSDGSGFAAVTNYNTANNFLMTMIVERTHDGAGNPTGDGVYLWLGSATSSGGYLLVIPAAGTVPNGYSYIGGASGMAVSPLQLTGNGVSPPIMGPNVPVLPLLYLCGKVFVVKMAHVVQPSLVSAGFPLSAAILGGSHTIMPLATPQAGATPTYQGDTLCLLWE